jgi:hypothetical protein
MESSLMHLAPAATEAPARFGRALLALTAAATIAVAPFADYAFGPAGSGHSAHTVPVWGFAMLAHDVGHNDWAFQSTTADQVALVAGYLAVGLFWLVVAVWVRVRGGHYLGRILAAAWGAQTLAGCLTVGAVWFARSTSTSLDPFALHVADLCSPWWACVAATLVVARAERSAVATRGALAYGVVLALLLLVPLPGPDSVKALVLAAAAAVSALMTPRQPELAAPAAADAQGDGGSIAVMPEAVAAG